MLTVTVLADRSSCVRLLVIFDALAASDFAACTFVRVGHLGSASTCCK